MKESIKESLIAYVKTKYKAQPEHEFLFYRDDERDDYWHCGAGTLVKAGEPDEGCLQSPGTAHCGSEGVPFCSEAWDAISRYIYTALQGGAIMHGWTKDDRVMIACCNDGTRPVIFKIQRIDCEESDREYHSRFGPHSVYCPFGRIG